MTYDPNFPARDRDRMDDPSAPRGWTLGIGVLVVLAIIAFLATGKQHSGDQAANAPMARPASNAMVNPPAPAAPLSPTLPAARSPTETTGSGTTENK